MQPEALQARVWGTQRAGVQTASIKSQPWPRSRRLSAPQQLVGAQGDQRAAPAVRRRPHLAALAQLPALVAPQQPLPARAQACLRCEPV